MAGGGGLSVLVFAALPAAAQVDTSEWKCEYCPFPEGYEAEVVAGATHVGDDAARFGNASGYDESGTYANLDGVGSFASESYRLKWAAEDLALDSRKLTVTGGKPGTFGFRLAYSELPYRLFNTTETVFSGSGDTLSLPSGWIPASQTPNMPGLATALRPRFVESDRKTLGVGGDFEAGPRFSLFADYRRQQKEGVDIVGGSNFAQAALLPRVFDFQTDLVDAGVRYSSGPLNLKFAWFGSFFDNSAGSLTWDNPFQTFPGAGQGRMAVEPDNSFTQLSLSGTYRAEVLDTVIGFTAATGQGEQDEDLLAYTINSQVSAGALPRARLDGKVDTSNYALTVTSRPIEKARVRLSYRYDERDNQTPQDSWSRVVVDGFLAPDTDTNVPYSYQRTKLSVVGDYRLLDTLNVAAGYENTALDRDFLDVLEQTEESSYGQLRWRPTPALELDARGGTARREVDSFDGGYAALVGQNPLLAKYYLAYRYREFGDLTLAFTPADLPVSVSLNAMYADDSYTESRLGLLAAEELHLSADLGWTVSEKASLYLNAGSQSIEAEQAGSSIFAAPNWSATHDDDFMTYGAGLRYRQLAGKVDLMLDYSRADGESEIVVDPPAGLQSEFPELESGYEDLRLVLSFSTSARLRWDLKFRYYRFETEDWGLQGIAPDTVPSLLSLGAEPYDEDVFAVGLAVRYAIGGGEAE